MKKVIATVAILLMLAGVGIALWFNFAPPAQVARTLVELERRLAGLEAKTVAIPGFRIAYLEGGHGEPLVLVHGFGGDKDNFTRIARHLTPHFRVIALDLPGFGESDKPAEQSYRTAEQTERLHALLDVLGIRSVHLGGNSMGGRIALEYAAKYPTDLKSVWLLAPAGVITAQPSDMVRRLERGEPIPLLARTPAEFDQLLGIVMAVPPYIPEPIKGVLAARGAANYALHRRIFEEIGKEWTARPSEELATAVRTPVRIVWGKNDAVLHVSGADILRRAMPASSVLALDGVGHLPMLEAPKLVAEDYLAHHGSLAR